MVKSFYWLPSPELGSISPAVRTGSSRSAVSNLDFELRKVRESQNSPGGVRAKALTPLSQLVNTSQLFRLVYFLYGQFYEISELF